MKRPKFTIGEVLEIPLDDGKYGYARVLMRDWLGNLLEIFNEKTSEPMKSDGWSQSDFSRGGLYYVNSNSAKNRWNPVLTVKPKQSELVFPSFFFGTESSGWTVETGGEKRCIPAHRATYDELIKRGYIHKILWLAEDIERALAKGEQLVWPGQK